MGIFLFFIDGFGLGDADERSNPFLVARLPVLTGLCGGTPGLRFSGVRQGGQSLVVSTDATLGVPGLPQSATGQTAIFTGVNAATHVGHHVNAHPTPALAAILQGESIFKRVAGMGRRPTFLNAYRPEFFTWLEGLRRGERARNYRPSATTLAVLAAGLRFRDLTDLAAGRAVYHDITNDWLEDRGYVVTPVEPEEAGRRAAAVHAEQDLTVFEYFLTDLVGHRGDTVSAVASLETIDRFLGALLADLDLGRDLLVITSDHGNVEDLSILTHTTNLVPTIAVGRGRERIAREVRDLTDIAPALLGVLAEGMV